MDYGEGGFFQTIRMYITLARPSHWLKNGLIFVPLLYANNITQLSLLISAIQCFAAFCLLTSAVYIVNDIIDAAKDRRHPIKKNRPIAAGRVAVNRALFIAVFLYAISFTLTVVGYGNYQVMLFALLYALLNLAYSLLLKHYAILDCFCIAAGFVLRIFAGGAASNSAISEWLFLTMVAVSLFMAFGKRRGEMVQVAANTATRKVLASYNVQFLDGMIFVCAGLSVVFYALWSMLNRPAMIYTVPLVIFIVCKYLLTVHGETSHGDPTAIILSDKGLLLAVGIFGLLSVALLYL
jgi:4-hydroxybenzoate polyprenyltransferase